MRAVFRYPGSKWSIAGWIISHFPEGYEKMVYLEPFLGSGAVFFNKNPGAVETINDLDSDVVNLFQILRDRPDDLKRVLELTPYSREEYDKSFEPCEDPLEKARRYMVKTTQATGAALTGGADGTVQSAAYSAYLTAIEPYKFDIMVYDGSDSTVQTALLSFIERVNENNGQYCQLVASGLSNPDSRYVINTDSPVTLSDGTELTPQQVTWWAGGASAGALYNQSLTYAQYPGAVSTTMQTVDQFTQAVQAGNFVLFAENGVVKVMQDINSLTTYTEDIGQVYSKNRVMRLCNTIANDIFQQFSESFIGVVNNNEQGRARFQAAIVGYLQEIQDNQGIQNFTSDDVEVLAGSAIDAIVVNVAIQAVDSVEKVYLSLEIS